MAPGGGYALPSIRFAQYVGRVSAAPPGKKLSASR
ncbi:hypothetical protein KPNJ2_04342 [Klebsiella pneumoniae 30684/NJST258_2]|uniref:Uncharacterized protein n=1 Tax=Klebsiella pneumoniae 30684/NJST258_2 TaxID=1420013 RepID=W8V4K7_KLEPN|nr:hypothetical protein KPNJ2_04342 [Klebsiella pneumoniae 30684/NJST258_2]